MKHIPFTTLMLNALGMRIKTETRRLMKPVTAGSGSCPRELSDSPYGQVGDLLGVREHIVHNGTKWCYAYDGKPLAYTNTEAYEKWSANRKKLFYPAMYFPAFANRWELRLTSVRRERLGDMDHEAALREGIRQQAIHPHLFSPLGWYDKGEQILGVDGGFDSPTSVGSYAKLWNSLHADHLFELDSYIWVYQFDIEKGPTHQEEP